MKKVAIYTALTGNYDSIAEPAVIDPRCDYICFTNNNFEKKNSIWEFRSIPQVAKSEALLSRYPKMHPHILLADYDYSVYLDANIQITGQNFYDRVFSKIENGATLSGIKHPFRNCPYNEGYVVFTYKLDSFPSIVRTLRFIRKQGFPRHYGMFEANVIFRKHADENVRRQCELWWSLVNRFSARDQLTYSYTLWKTGIPFDYIIPDSMSARNYPGFHFTPHVRQKSIWGINGLFKKIGKFVYWKLISL